MELLTSAASPFARKVRVLLRETGQIKTVKENENRLYSYRDNWSVPQANPPICIPKNKACQVCPQYLDKNTNKYLVALAVFSGFFLNSCSEEIVDLEPFGTVKSETAFSSPTLVLAAVNGVYNAAQMGVFKD